jgi:hypothetical protein
MTHYDPNDWEPDDEPPSPWPIAFAALVFWLVAAGLIWWENASAADLAVVSTPGNVLARCQLPTEFDPTTRTLVCPQSDTVFLDGFEGA